MRGSRVPIVAVARGDWIERAMAMAISTATAWGETGDWGGERGGPSRPRSPRPSTSRRARLGERLIDERRKLRRDVAAVRDELHHEDDHEPLGRVHPVGAVV